MKVVVVLFAMVALAVAEPPAPNSRYLPSNEYGAPAQTAAVIRPNNQYGTPSAPSSQYGTPSSEYGAPSNQYVPPSSQYGSPGGGYGRGGADDQFEPANYDFQYRVQDDASGNDFGHEEQRQGDVARGKYFVLLPDGRRQVVEYVADSEGYRPKISYEQVGGGYQNGGYPSGGGNGGYSGGNNGGYQY